MDIRESIAYKLLLAGRLALNRWAAEISRSLPTAIDRRRRGAGMAAAGEPQEVGHLVLVGDQREHLDSWTIAIHTDDVKRNDDFALWIRGPQAGVYPIGKLGSGYNGPFRVSGGYWIDPPQGDVYGVDIEATRYLFDHPILKPDLVAW